MQGSIGPKVYRGENVLSLTQTQTRILYILACYFQGFLKMEPIIMFTWSNDDEPEDAYKNVQVHICRMRKNLHTLGLQIVSRSGYGYCLAEASDKLYTFRRVPVHKKPWAGRELAQLDDLVKAGHDMRSLSEILGRSESSIKAKLYTSLGIRSVPSENNPRPWTEADEKTLTEMSRTHTSVEIAKVLDRGELSIKHRLYYRRLRGDAYSTRRREGT